MPVYIVSSTSSSPESSKFLFHSANDLSYMNLPSVSNTSVQFYAGYFSKGLFAS
jgi:hypothetical protein